MNYLHKYLLCTLCCLVLATLLIVSCNDDKKQNTEQTPINVAPSPAPPAASINSSQSELLKVIVGPAGDGFFRGLNLGDPVAKIKATETFELFEDSTSHVGFTHETENLEAIDVIYFLDKNNTIKNIRVDTYLNSPVAVSGLQDQFETYLSGRFRNQKKDGKRGIWRGNGNVYIVLENVSKGKDYGLRLEMGPNIKVDL
jgi:hypothetical protein